MGYIKNRERKVTSRKWGLSIFTILMVGVVMGGVGVAGAATVPDKQPDSTAYVGFGWDGYLPAFKDAKGIPIPFKPTSLRPPIGYKGDFYVDEFTDAKIKQAWQELKAKDPEAAKKILASVSAGVNTDENSPANRTTGWLDPKGAVNGNDDLKLTNIRRPAFFGQAPWFEDIAKLEQNTYTVEFTVPRGLFEQLQLKLTDPIKLRGWFIKGKGITNAKGQKIHVLVIFNNGTSEQLCTIQHPDAPLYVYNVQTQQYSGVTYPNKNFQTERYGSLLKRQYLYDFNQAGFDVLMVDNRGHGISGGINGNDCGESAEDNFRMLDQLESGNGLTIVAPNGQLLQGKKTAGLLLHGIPAKQIPVIVAGGSRGSITTCYVMQKNFIGWTAFNEPEQKFTPAKKYNIKAAISWHDFAGGLGYLCTPGVPDLRTVYEDAAYRVEANTIRRPTSEILANIDKWPAVFFGQGLWDNRESPEGTFEAYRRAKGLKELVFVQGGHGESKWGAKNTNFMLNKMIEFSVRAVVNSKKKYPELKSFKEAVLRSPPYWEPISRL